MALVVLFVSMGWDVKFHYCTEDHHLTSSLSDAAAHCEHCIGHHHGHYETEAHDWQHDIVRFEAKCCCEDYESLIQFSDNYVFSSEKHLNIYFEPVDFAHLDFQELLPKTQQVFQHFTARKILHFFSAREMLVFFSSLRLNPLVF